MTSTTRWKSKKEKLKDLQTVLIAVVLLLVLLARPVGSVLSSGSSGWGPLFDLSDQSTGFVVWGAILLLSLVGLRERTRLGRAAIRLASLPYFVKVLIYVLLVIGGGILFWTFREQIVIGDGPDFMLHAPRGVLLLKAPGETILQHLAYTWYVQIDPLASPREALALLSSVAGALTLALVILIAFELSDRLPCRLFAIGLVLTAYGVSQLLFGHIESTPITIAAFSAYVLSGLRYTTGKSSLVWPSLLLGLAIILHNSAIWLLPSLLPLIGRGLSDVRHDAQAVARRFLPLVLVGMPWLGLYGYLGELGYIFTPKWGGIGSFVPPWTIFGTQHIKWFIAEYLLLCPVPIVLGLSALAILGLRWLADPMASFLGTMAVFHVIYSFVWRATLPGYHDWDLFSASAPLVSLFAAHAFIAATQHNEVLKHLFLPACLIGLFYTLPMLVWTHSHRSVEDVDFAQPSRSARADVTGLSLIDSVDVGNESSERAHNYSVGGLLTTLQLPYPLGLASAPPNSASVTPVTFPIEILGVKTSVKVYPPGVGGVRPLQRGSQDVIAKLSAAYPSKLFTVDDGRWYEQSEEFTVRTVPSRNVVLIKRIHSGLGNQRLRVYVDDSLVGEWQIDCATEQLQNFQNPRRGMALANTQVNDRASYPDWQYWLEPMYVIPEKYTSGSQIKLKLVTIEGPVDSFSYFVYQ